MNIFILDYEPHTNVKYYCDKHIVKMILETVQLLHGVYYFTNEQDKATYKLTHKNHPCAKWVRESLSNWNYLYSLGLCMYNEYKYRYNKTHKSGELLLNNTKQPEQLEDIGLTPFAQCMPDNYKQDDTVQAYREYYAKEKYNILTWKNREEPQWIKQIKEV